MSDSGPSHGYTWRYRFARPDGTEIDEQVHSSDDAAVSAARALPLASETPIVIHRHDLVDWQYVTEIDERP